MSSPEKSASSLPLGMILLFVLPALVTGFMHGPEQQLQGLYAKYAGLALGALAAATLLTRAFDAVSYPVIGYLSDLTYARTGTRKPWVIAGAIVSAIGVWFLYRPPSSPGIAYYCIWSAVTYIGWKIGEIPYQAWSFSLTRDYKQRARVQGYRAFAVILGGMFFYAMPALAKATGLSATSDLGFPALGLTAIFCAILVPLVAILVIWRVPEGEGAPPQTGEQRRFGVIETFRSVIANHPMLRLVGAILPVSILTGMSTGVIFLYLDVYMRLGEAFPTIMLLTIPVTLLGVPVWSALSVRFERHKVVAVSMVVGSIAFAAVAVVPPGLESAPYMMILFPLAFFALSGTVAIYPIIGDVSDYGRLHAGRDLGGVYTAAFNFVQVSLRMVSGAAGIAIIGWMGFDATNAAQSATGALGIRLVAVVFPALGLGMAGLLFWTFPLTRARLAEIQDQLANPATEVPS